MYEESKTLVDIIYNSVNNYGDKVFLKYRENGKYKSITFPQFLDYMESLSASLYDIGIRKGDKVGLISDNQYKWLISDMAILALGCADVPRGSDSLAYEIEYILNHSEAKYSFVEDAEQADKILSVKKNLPNLKVIILFSDEKNDIKESISEDIAIYTFDDLVENGKKQKDKYKEKLDEIKRSIQIDDLATLVYTSGTTGNPKGVMLLHKNIMHNVHNMPLVLPFNVTSKFLSILPSWHMYERTIEYLIMVSGALMAYSKPTARYLLPDFEEIKPTHMVSVPRVWEALYTGIVAKVKGGSKLRYGLFKFFLSIGNVFTRSKKYLFNQIPWFKPRNPIITGIKKIWNLSILFILFPLNFSGKILVFSKIKKKTGGKLTIPISGAGALATFVDNFFSVIGIDIYEGYGLTETSPIVSVRTLKLKSIKTVGPPGPNIEIKIADEHGKALENQHKKGIVFVRGDLVMKGYYKEPEKTKAVLSEDGWFNTGDLGRFTMTGELQLAGRAKDTIVLTGGENIEPVPIENKLLESQFIDQVMVVGQDKKNLGVLIVPNEEEVMNWAKNNKVNEESYNVLLKDKNIDKLFSDILKNMINEHNGFRDYERMTRFALLEKQFEIGDELTHTLKLRRNVIQEKYKKIICRMYNEDCNE